MLEGAVGDYDSLDARLDAIEAGSGVSAHASTHIHSGTDEIDGDLLDVDYSPSNYTSTSGSNGTTSTQELTSHLKGIDTKLGGTFTATAHASSHVHGAGDEVDGDLLDVDYSPTNYTSTSGANGTSSTQELTSHLTGIDAALLAAKTTTYAWRGPSLASTSGATFYVQPWNASTASTATLVNAQLAWGRTGTFTNLRFKVINTSLNAATASVTLNINGSDTNLTVTVAGNSSTLVSDTNQAHNASVSVGDLITFKQVNNASTSINNFTVMIDFVEP
jgi:hypothetical protein